MHHFLQREGGGGAVTKAWGNVLAGISSSFSEPKLRNFTCVPESPESCLPGTPKAFYSPAHITALPLGIFLKFQIGFYFHVHTFIGTPAWLVFSFSFADTLPTRYLLWLFAFKTDTGMATVWLLNCVHNWKCTRLYTFLNVEIFFIFI